MYVLLETCLATGARLVEGMFGSGRQIRMASESRHKLVACTVFLHAHVNLFE